MIDLSSAAVQQRALVHAPPGVDTDDLAVLDARMLWSGLTEPGDGVAGALIAACGPVRALEIALGSDDHEAVAAAGLDGLQLAQARARWRPRMRDAPEAGHAARRAGIRVVTPEQSLWPRRLDDLGVHAPVCLWVRGEPRALGAAPVAVALVGARASSAYGEHVVGEMAAELAGSGVAIVSGAAYGIDGVAHRAAVAAGGTTTAWLAGGVDRPYPAGHRDLLDRIAAAGGAIVADVPCGSAPTKWRFLARNRLIAASSDAVVVVEAGWRSGSLNTAAHAATLGRALGAVPGPVTSASSAGCHRLLREFDARCVTGADDVRELLRIDPAPALFDDAFTDDLTRVRDALSSRVARPVGDIARRSGLSVDDAAGLLGMLSLDGAAISSPDGWRGVVR